jgi:hypothetical protein
MGNYVCNFVLFHFATIKQEVYQQMGMKQEPCSLVSGILSVDKKIAPKEIHLHRFNHWKKDENGERYYYCECGQRK